MIGERACREHAPGAAADDGGVTAVAFTTLLPLLLPAPGLHDVPLSGFRLTACTPYCAYGMPEGELPCLEEFDCKEFHLTGRRSQPGRTPLEGSRGILAREVLSHATSRPRQLRWLPHPRQSQHRLPPGARRQPAVDRRRHRHLDRPPAAGRLHAPRRRRPQPPPPRPLRRSLSTPGRAALAGGGRPAPASLWA